MLISFHQEVSRDMPIKSLDGKNYYLVEVVAFVLLHLKNQLMSHLSKIGHYNPSPFDFDWVVTVPAIWKARGKQMMREAASLVSLLYVLALQANIKWWYNVIVLCSVTASHRLCYSAIQCHFSALCIHK